MKYILIGLVVIGIVGILALALPMFGNKYGQPISSEQIWKEKIAQCSVMNIPKNVNVSVKKFSEDGRRIIVSGSSTTIYDCPDDPPGSGGMFVY